MKTVLHYYRYNLDNEQENQEYKELCEYLKSLGLKKFDSIAHNHLQWYKETVKPLDGQKIKLDADYLFDNQWNTAPIKTSGNGLRIFDWAEAIYPNCDVREGEWLEQTLEMVEARQNRVKCGYCGKQYQAQQGHVFCLACLGSKYLKDSDLFLLRVLPLGVDRRPQLTQAEYDWIYPQYVEAQTEATKIRGESRKAKQYKHIENDYNKATIEYKGFKWLLDNNMDADNWIYYDHKDEFCYGWRTPINSDVAKKIHALMQDFPYNYVIVTK